MSKLNTWSVGINRKLEKQRDNIHKSDYRFFNIAALQKVAERLDQFSDECSTCNNMKTDMEKLVDNLPEYLSGNLQKRREFEKLSNTPINHLRKKHKLYPPNYFTSVYTLFGFVGGIAVGCGIALIVPSVNLLRGITIGFVMGLLAGYIGGIIKDRKQKQKNLTL